MNAETEFQIEFCTSAQSKQKNANNNNYYKRSKSVSNFDELEISEKYQNKENENNQQICNVQKRRNGLILDSSCLSGMPSLNPDKRRGVKMGVRAFRNVSQMRVCRSMEAVNTESTEDLEQLSLHSVSICCSSPSTPKSPLQENDVLSAAQAYILGEFLVYHITKSLQLCEQYENTSHEDQNKNTSISFLNKIIENGQPLPSKEYRPHFNSAHIEKTDVISKQTQQK